MKAAKYEEILEDDRTQTDRRKSLLHQICFYSKKQLPEHGSVSLDFSFTDDLKMELKILVKVQS